MSGPTVVRTPARLPGLGVSGVSAASAGAGVGVGVSVGGGRVTVGDGVGVLVGGGVGRVVDVGVGSTVERLAAEAAAPGAPTVGCGSSPQAASSPPASRHNSPNQKGQWSGLQDHWDVKRDNIRELYMPGPWPGLPPLISLRASGPTSGSRPSPKSCLQPRKPTMQTWRGGRRQPSQWSQNYLSAIAAFAWTDT